jgi:hypothetical protein
MISYFNQTMEGISALGVGWITWTALIVEASEVKGVWVAKTPPSRTSR